MKLAVNFIVVFFVFLIGSYLWPYINIPFSNPENIVGILTLSKYNPNTDTIRFLFIICLTTISFFFKIYFQEKRIFKIGRA